MKRKVIFWSLLFIYTAVVGRIAWMAYSEPLNNWDTLSYMAIILAFEKTDLPEIHQEVYAELKKTIPEETFRSHTDSKDTVFAGKVFEDYHSFFRFTSLFRTKPFYNFCSYLAYKAGIPLAKAPVFPSIISFICISFFLAYWLGKILKLEFTFIACLSIVLSTPLIEGARLSTPDALSAFILLIGIYLLLIRVNWYWIAIVLSAAILTRLDNIIIAFLLMVFLLVNPESANPTSKPSRTLFAVVVLVWFTYSLIILEYSSYENSTSVFYQNIFTKINPSILIQQAIAGLPTLQHSSLSVVVAIAFVTLFWRSNFKFKTFDLDQWLFVILITQVVVKYLLFPVMWDRLYLATFIVLIILILKRLTFFTVKNAT